MTLGRQKLEIAESITQSEVGEIVHILQDCGAVLPLAVWSSGFKDILDGELVGGIPNGHVGHYSSYEDAAFQYLFLSKMSEEGPGSTDKSLQILVPDRIIDATGKQILPR